MATKCKPFSCTFCEKSYTSGYCLRQHLKVTHGPPVPNLTCNVCNKTLFTPKNLRKHKVTYQHYTIEDVVSPQTKKFMCDHCNFQTDFETDLPKHSKSTHSVTTQTNFECPFGNCLTITHSKGDMHRHFETIHCSDYAFYKYLHSFSTCRFCNQDVTNGEFITHTQNCGRWFFVRIFNFVKTYITVFSATIKHLNCLFYYYYSDHPFGGVGKSTNHSS